MEAPENYIGQVIDIYSTNVAAIVHPDGTEELAHNKYTIDGKYKVIDYDEGNNEFALIIEEDAQRGEGGLDFTPYVYYVEADSVGGYQFDYEEHSNPEHDEIKTLYEQYGTPAVEHPLGEHTGAMNVDIPFNELVELHDVRSIVRDGDSDRPDTVEQEFMLDGTYEIIDYNDMTHEIGVITEEDSVANNMSATIYYAKYDDILGNKQTPEATKEVDQLQQAFDVPATEHPLGEHTGYNLNTDLKDVLEEQMIEGGVPESEVDPSINDIEEAMDKRLKNKKGNQEYDLEAYANVPEEFNQKLIALMGHMRAAGVPQETIMHEIRDLIDIYVSSNPNNMQTNNEVTSMDNNRLSAPDEHFISAMTPAELNKHLAADLANEPVPTQGFPEQNSEPEVMPEEPEGLDEIAEPTAVEKVEEYLSNMHSEGTEFWNYIHDAEMSLMKGDIEGAQADLRIMVEILNNLNQ